MYLPRELISHLYNNLLRSHQPSSSPVLIISSLETDAICACRVLTSLFRRDYISYRIQPVAGYADLQNVGERLVRPMKTSEGGSGGVVICLGVGGLVDLASQLGLESEEEDDMGDVEVWVLDARRPWNLSNVFGGLSYASNTSSTSLPRRTPGVEKGCIQKSYRSGRGGIIVFDDGDIVDELSAEQDAFYSLAEMPEVDDDLEDEESEDVQDDDSHGSSQSRKRKSWSDRDESDDEERPQQRRRSNSKSTIASHRSRSQSPTLQPKPKEPSAKDLRKKLQSLRISHEKVLQDYYSLGTSYSEPISSLAYSLASELGREDNDLLWLAIVGVTSLELSGHTSTGLGTPHAKPDISRGLTHSWRMNRSSRTYALLRDETRRLNPPTNGRQSLSSSRPPVTSATDSSIQLVPDPRFMLLRHWSLYESMLHSPYLASRLHVWNESGVKRLHKLLAKMGISLQQCKQGYMHMNVAVRADLRERLLKYANMYGLEELVPVGEGSATYEQEGWGFLRTWGWKAQLSAVDVSIIVSAILEVVTPAKTARTSDSSTQQTDVDEVADRSEALVQKYFQAFDALAPNHPNLLLAAVPKAQTLLRSIHRTGSQLLNKHQLRHLRAFRMGVVKDGPDLSLFANSPGALVKLALWVAEAVAVSERDKKGTNAAIPFVLAALDEARGTYVVVGTGSGIGSGEDLEARKEKADRKAKKQAEREVKKKVREEKRAARRLQAELNGESDDEEESEEEEESDDEEVEEQRTREQEKRGYGRNRFGIAFQEVVEETQARVKIDSFDHCVVEVKKEDLGGFLEGLSLKIVRSVKCGSGQDSSLTNQTPVQRKWGINLGIQSSLYFLASTSTYYHSYVSHNLFKMPQSSLWVIPPRDDHPFNKSLLSLIQETIPSDFPRVPKSNFKFLPHVTVTSEISPSTYGSDAQSWLDNLSLPTEFQKEKVEPTIELEEIEVGDVFFRKLTLRAKKDENLVKLASVCRSQGLGVSDEEGKKWAESEYAPHLSLMYADLERAEVQKKVGLVELQLGWEFGSLFDCCGGTLAMGGRLVLVDTSGDVEGWKVLASRECNWMRWTMARGLI
ncbi:DNA replication initiation factor cdc45 [Lithohypha guttulata]|nr:DNA replication initiation factor cdc45 [Lithohypha guttulata]